MSEPRPAAPLMKDMLGEAALGVIAAAGAAAAASTAAATAAATSGRFDHDGFLETARAGLASLSIMERVRHIADALAAALPPAYPEALEIVVAMGPHLGHAFQAVAVTEFVARRGLDHFDLSMAALARLTRHGTAEFAVRPFLAADPARTLDTMLEWSGHEDAHVRRLASEGCRPRLPWAGRIPALTADPTLAAAILERLKADPSLYVRKSVANHLNDIAKDAPDWVVARLGQWPQDDARTRWIVRHALRTLIKHGDPRALALIGAGHGAEVTPGEFTVTPARLRLGGEITIAAELTSTGRDVQRLVVDYRLHYARPSGKSAAKVFKLRTFDLAAGETVRLAIRQTIRDFSTRRHHPGVHAIDLLVNGKAVARGEFVLEQDLP
ncbi:DNA alkylation repair protein [Sphingomonas sp. IC081]|uniref:DNA alkylation repair protein n=1 Tax=Sphingomonas sp. IC081 TaxID=304378 RepID=UPI00115B43A9|nr:DNA alkylation repair protein [Sphingomonas sp. IC081]QDK35415.1 DNA alkylation repair protein [Sphingomonas sp. IC081]